MDRVLVTGANGFVGRHVIKELADNNYAVVGVGGPQGLSEPSPYLAEYVSLDLTDAEASRQLNFKDITGVIHLAGLAAVGASFDNPEQYLTTNVGIEVNLFEAAI